MPTISYSDGLSKAWAAKIEGDIFPEGKQRSRLPSAVAALTACLFIAIFFAGRWRAVDAAPDLARLYAAVGLPVNLAGLEISDLTAERRTENADGRRVVLRGTIRNLSDVEQTLPALTARLYALDGRVAGVRKSQAPAPTIGAGDALSFEIELDPVPEEAAEIVVRFQRAEEPIAVSDVNLKTE